MGKVMFKKRKESQEKIEQLQMELEQLKTKHQLKEEEHQAWMLKIKEELNVAVQQQKSKFTASRA
ncbi:hypothetical protein ACI2OX_16260 [Bacillus sp. N9]